MADLEVLPLQHNLTETRLAGIFCGQYALIDNVTAYIMFSESVVSLNFSINDFLAERRVQL